ncbi:adenosine kinase [Babesia caballi]|uniref:Adenosine kinase n=1 Tax=Babesia caballi TaxID=5871 RepID=A0AAV4M1K2_BABCB|nr:adenosine kinase [Babesia caballi]
MNSSSFLAAVFGVFAAFASTAICRDASGNERLELGPTRLFFAGNAMVDMFARVDQSVIDSLNFAKGESNGITPETFKALGEKVQVESKNPGGSSANTARAYAYLGGKASYFGLIGEDELADDFDSYLGSYGVDMKTIRRPGTFTSQLYSLVTPDAERSMYLLFGASRTIVAEDVDASVMDDYDYYVVNGFMFGTPGHIAFTNKMIDAALSRGKKIITLFANSVCIRKYSEHLKPVAAKSAYLSGNLEEFSKLYGIDDKEELFLHFEDLTSVRKLQHKAVIITMGGEGAYIIFRGKRYFVPPTGVEVVDTTGAGDFFAGSVLYGLLNGFTVEQSGEFARAVLSDILTHMGTSVSEDVRAKVAAIKHSA